MNVLPQVETIKFILLENVCGFERSDSRDLVIKTLTVAGFSVEEFLICPRQIGIPNSRLRYYLLARRDIINNTQESSNREILTDFNALTNSMNLLNIDKRSRDLSDYLDELSDTSDYNLTDEVLAKHAKVLDVVRSDSLVSCCFTSGYHRYCEGTGSVLQTQGTEEDFHEAYRAFSDTSDVEHLKKLQLRYFTPAEIARILGFPSSFTFPDSVTLKQKYKVLGNSLNVTVVSLLICHLLREDSS